MTSFKYFKPPIIAVLALGTLFGCASSSVSTPRVGPSPSPSKPTQVNVPRIQPTPVPVADEGTALLEWPTLPPEDIMVSPTPSDVLPSASPTLPPLERIASVRFTKTVKGNGVEIRPVYLDAKQQMVTPTFNGDSNLSYTVLESNLNWEIVSGSATLNTSKPTLITEGTTDALHDKLKTGPTDITAQLRLPNNVTLSTKRQAFLSSNEFQNLQIQAQQAASPPPINAINTLLPVKLTFKAALIRKNGDIVPIPRTRFEITPYNLRKIRANLQLKNSPPPKPKDPTVRTGDLKRCNNPSLEDAACEDYRLQVRTYREQLLPEWERFAYQGEALEIALQSTNRSKVMVTTDLSGEASLQLMPGVWYVSGTYLLLDGRASLTWDSTPVEIKSDTQRLEVSNENARVLNPP